MSQTQRHAALSLYKQILQLHKQKLPFDARMLGNQYVREEFQLHKKAKGEQLRMFMSEWRNYVEILRSQSEVVGEDLKEDVRQMLSADQRKQLDKLKDEAHSFAKAEDDQFKI
eukprot:TRINITY_DN237_c0_g2_i1.p2 TRINITY_DN237_c0_g2~~TRINITY_DN237_c0_g2_i1.p2  ORF type:complete len:113 (-),score=31.42 TRINITY_DN237_c0_g2_i1:451-789(-)